MTTTRLAARFADEVASVRHRVEPRYVRPDWAERNTELERELLALPPSDLLRHPAIPHQTFVDDGMLRHELLDVLARFVDLGLLADAAVGAPATVSMSDGDIRTSSNTVAQVYHLLRPREATGRSVGDAATIVECRGRVRQPDETGRAHARR